MHWWLLPFGSWRKQLLWESNKVFVVLCKCISDQLEVRVTLQQAAFGFKRCLVYLSHLVVLAVAPRCTGVQRACLVLRDA